MNPSRNPPVTPPRNWVVREADENSCHTFVQSLNVSPITARILHNRGIRDQEGADRFLNTSLQHLTPSEDFPEMEKAVNRIQQAVLAREQVLIYGDYDVDGLTSTAVLVHFLRRVGLDPLFHVPDRLQEGYGFHQDTLPSFSAQGVRLIITVDCGVSAVDTVEAANRLGIDVIITDHHECSSALPPALAVLNPKAPGSGFPFRELAGVGVAFYLLIALRMRLRQQGFWKDVQEPNLLEYLDLVALGTLADMVPLKQQNRIFVKYGLQEITKANRPGISVLKQQAGIDGEVKQARPLVFRMIPRINAPGRLGCAGVSLDILLCEDAERAREIAKVLEGRNRERKSIENKVYRKARLLAQKQVEQERPVLVIAGDGWHKGILGIVASRIAQEFRRPAALLSFEGAFGKGSIRSVDKLEILDAVFACQDLLENFGGHKMAAGISLKRENLEPFQAAFEEAVLRRIQLEKEKPDELLLDFWVENPADIDDVFMEELERIGPFGYGNEEPVLGMGRVKIVKKDRVGGDHLKLVLESGAVRFESIGFGMAEQSGVMESSHPLWDVAFTPQQDTWRGRTRNSLRLIEIRPSSL